jgi:hypothetical protein
MKIFITKSTDTRETITVDGVEYPVVKWRSLELSSFYTGKTNLSILQDVLINSKLNTLNTLNNFNFVTYSKAFGRLFFI